MPPDSWLCVAVLFRALGDSARLPYAAKGTCCCRGFWGLFWRFEEGRVEFAERGLVWEAYVGRLLMSYVECLWFRVLFGHVGCFATSRTVEK